MAVYAREGLRIVFTAIAGVTDAGLLRTPYRFQLPPLDEFERELTYNQVTYDTVKNGQFSRRGGRQLRTSSWSSLVVDVGMDSRGQPTPTFVMLNASPHVEKLIDGLHDLVESGSPFMYTATHHFPGGGILDDLLPGPEVRWPAQLTRVHITEKSGEGDARYFDLDLQEWRDPTVGRARQGKGGGTAWPAHAIIRGDGFAYDAKTNKQLGSGSPATLTQLARHYYHDPSAWKVIASANNLRGVSASTNLASHFKLKGKATHKLTIPKPAVIGKSLTAGRAAAVQAGALIMGPL